MSGISVPASPVRRGLRGILRSWLQTWAGDLQPVSEAPNPDRHGAIRVLVVDDDPANLMVISAQMELLGVLPLLAADGAEAVAIACETHFDLILMDLQMPILGGLEATATIRRFEDSRSLPAVPIIAYTSSAPEVGVMAACGINGRLAKPCGIRDIEDCLSFWCRGYLPEPGLGAAGHDGPSGPAARQGWRSATAR